MLALLASSHVVLASLRTTDPPMFLTSCSFAGIPLQSAQLLIVAGNKSRLNSVAVYAAKRKPYGWIASFPPIDATIGRNGFAEPGAKREGDGKTPSGVYPLLYAFGYAHEINTKMPYRQAGENDIWVNDPSSLDYNKWVRQGETTAISFENMKRKDGFYRYGVVIGHNIDPVVRGHGSAIFLHVWKRRDAPTSGCVAMAQKNLVHILGWLDPLKKPLIIMGTKEALIKFDEMSWI